MDSTTSMDKALAELREQDLPNFTEVSKKYEFHRTTLSRRYWGKTTSADDETLVGNRALTKVQERHLVDLINKLTLRGLPPTPHIVKNLTEEIRGSAVGKNWVAEFVKRHGDDLKSLYLRRIDNSRVKSEYWPAYKYFYDTLLHAIEKYHITADNMYNVDEKGFVMGHGSNVKRIMSKKLYESGKIMQAVKDGNREFTTLIAYINALGKAGKACLLYKGESGDLQDTWVEDLEVGDEAFFGSTANGWSNNAMGLEWLRRVFEVNTRPKSSRTWRLLIVDGHSSHVNLEFIDYAFDHHIMILLLPPHSTHRLQPLDATMFGLLATEYQNEMNLWLHKSLGRLKFTKRDFWRVFRPAWRRSFLDNEKGVLRSFEKTGIWPWNPAIVLDIIAPHWNQSTPPRELTPPLQEPPHIPRGALSVARAQRAYISNPSPPKLERLFEGQRINAAQHEIDNHLNRGLIETLELEKKRRKRGKRLNLLGEEGGKAQLFEAPEILKAKEIAKGKDDAKAQKDAERQLKQEEIAAKKAREAKELLERKIERHNKRVAAARVARDIYMAKEAEKEQFNIKEKGVFPSRIVILSIKFVSDSSIMSTEVSSKSSDESEEEMPILTNRRGRQIILPTRFQNKK